MANGQTSYSDWARQNEDVINQVAQRSTTPVAPAAPAAPVTIQVNTQPQGAAAPAAQAAPSQPAPQSPTPEQPAPQEQAVQPPAPPPVEAVTMPTRGSTRSQLADVQKARVEDPSVVAQSYLRQGEIDSAGAQKKADVLGQAIEAKRPIIEAAEKNAAGNRETQGKYKQYEDEYIEALRKPIIDDRSALQKAGGIFAGIVSSMFQGRGIAGGAISYGMDAVTDYVNRSLTDQLQAKDTAGKALPHIQKAMEGLAKDSADHAEVAGKLAANQYLMAEDALKKIAEETKVPGIKENAYQLAMASREKANGILQPILEARAKAEAAAAAAKAKGNLAALEDWQLRKLGTPEAMKILKARYDTDEQAAGIQEKQANTAKTMGEAKKAADGGDPAPIGWEVENPGVYAALRPEERSDFRAKQAAVAEMKASIAEAQALMAKYGTEATGKNSELLKTHFKNMVVKFNKANKLGALDEGTLGLVQDITGDPNAIFTSGNTVAEKLKILNNDVGRGLNESARYLGLRSQSPEDQLARDAKAGPRQDGPTPESAPAVAGPLPPPAQQQDSVIMVLPMTGQHVPVPANRPDLIDGMRQKRGAVTLEEYQDAERQQQFDAEQGANALAYSEGR